MSIRLIQSPSTSQMNQGSEPTSLQRLDCQPVPEQEEDKLGTMRAGFPGAVKGVAPLPLRGTVRPET